MKSVFLLLAVLIVNCGVWGYDYQIDFEDLPDKTIEIFPSDYYLNKGVVIEHHDGSGLYRMDFNAYEGDYALFCPHAYSSNQHTDIMFYERDGAIQIPASEVSLWAGDLWHTYYVQTLDQNKNVLDSITVTGTVDADWRNYTFNTPVYGIRIQTSAIDGFGIDNLEYSLVPEPATISLLALGVFVAGRRRKKH